MPGDFCPKCGKKIKRGVKFCPYCGANIGPVANQNTVPVKPQVTQPVVNQPVVNQNQPIVNQPMPQVNNRQQNKTKKLIALVVVAFLALLGGGGFYFYKISHPQNNLTAQKSSNLKPMNKLSSQDWAALVVTYAHNKYPKNSQWAKVYRDVKAGNASVEKSDEFTTEDGTVTAGDDEILYIVNDKTAFMLPTKTKDGSEKVTIADSDETLGTPTAREVYEAVQSQPNAANNIKELADSVTLYSNTGSSDDNDDSDEDSERDGFTDLQCAVMAYVYKDSSDPEGQIESLIDACTDYDAKDAWDTIPTGIGRYPNGGDHAYAISEGVDSKKFWVFKFDPDSDDVDITCHHNGKTTFHMTGNRAALIKRYGDYESDLNTLIKKINYNANHIDELRDKIDE